MNQLSPIEHSGQRVLTTAQLAEAYGTEAKRIQNNFSENRTRFTEGKHFILLSGQELMDFKNDSRNSGLVQKQASQLYLWTEKGAWMHAKSLNTDKAWEAYEMLVDDYYNAKQALPQLSELEMIAAIAKHAAEHEKRLSIVESRMEATEKRQEHISEVLSLNPTEWRRKTTELLNKISFSRGGEGAYQAVRNESYEKLEERAKCKLSVRVTNIRKRMALEGLPKSKIDKVSKLDAIAEDARLTEIYLAIVKEMAIQYKVDGAA
ncbi:ORF6N domain-containing protein [Brevibacillus borstelensis]|uniref:ORF6N domain-containing protein n=1 Tax=Brevibacillus borstelensis TaxID=45462 RepID=UPI00287F5598|nr:ORF6N domain-containing protein [Brevibacillus borstelensis]WNF07212.1 ORF6N domain-containing protein [Brevibacillus borstelensis]